jgi:hypothetical protein
MKSAATVPDGYPARLPRARPSTLLYRSDPPR